jgi:hypothetical protein
LVFGHILLKVILQGQDYFCSLFFASFLLNFSTNKEKKMEIKEQVIILKIKYDPSESYEPRLWNWVELLKCKNDCVEVLNYGKSEVVTDERTP